MYFLFYLRSLLPRASSPLPAGRSSEVYTILKGQESRRLSLGYPRLRLPAFEALGLGPASYDAMTFITGQTHPAPAPY